ncbi:EAL domain-containing protein [uncultured Brevundimonas sp.]|uniref:EAL domain-containing protein n=1 Tax=uncultured Brevundimonas sp. TaxID=213418 RepID=UPI002608A5AD|nr:EAL domain-containing protein [uncultured Brevundimonas sp.]
MSLAPRLLGLAFAAADALIEVDEKGIVRFALGAGPSPRDPVAQWIGHPLSERLDAESARAVSQMLSDLSPGERVAGQSIALKTTNGPDRASKISIFSLPEIAPAISCALTYSEPSVQLASSQTEHFTGLPDGAALLGSMRTMLMGENAESLEKLVLAFVDVAGMDAIPQAKLPEVYAGLNAALQAVAYDASLAGQLTGSRYALLGDADVGSNLEAKVKEMADAQGVTLSARAGQAPIGQDPASALRAIRFAIEACLRDQTIEKPEEHFAETLHRTLRDADYFRNLVSERGFALHYQPIVDLETRAVHHYEALSRFPRSASPAAAIRMAEELALIENFDRTVAEMALNRLRQLGSNNLQIAINVSGASLANDSYVTALLAMTASAPELRQRLLVEVTETAALADIASASRRLTALRDTGVRVCIDDFGVGSASFDYLRGLNVDIVKIDGSLVRDVKNNQRNHTLISHLVELCKSLNLETVAEMVETESEADTLRGLGIRYAQGWLFGRAEAEPRAPMESLAIRARRTGTTETWS